MTASADRPRIALLVPAYNAARYLPRLLESASNQSVPFDEVWIHDDCSSDDTARVAESYGAKVFRSPANRGCSAGKNILAKLTTAEWLHFHDADDELLPNFVALARKWIDRDQHDVVLFDYEYRDDQTGELLFTNRFDRNALESDARRYAIVRQINPFCGLYRRSAFLEAGGYDEDPLVLYNEDVAFHIRMAFAGLRFSSDSEISIINYRVGGSMSANNMKRCTIAHFHVLRRTWERPEAKPFARELGDKLWHTSGVLGSIDAWPEARAAANLAAQVHRPTKGVGNTWFRVLAQISPYSAIRIREASIRLLKPHLRRVPGS